MRLFKALLLAALVGGAAAGPAQAEVKPHPLFTDNMVLQQGTACPVWGKADPGEQVSVELSAGTGGGGVTATAGQDGKWMVTVMPGKAGTGYTLTIKGKNTVALKNVAVGEVWVCSGQSNMEWSVNASETPEKVKSGAKHPELRLFTVQKRTSPTPLTDQDDLKHFTKWVESSPDTVGSFSAVAYHFGVKLQKELGVPVGLIHTSLGGTPAEAWTSLEALESEPTLKHYAANVPKAAAGIEAARKAYTPGKARVDYEAALEKWKKATEAAKAAGKPEPKKPTLQGPPSLGPGTPSSLYNAMIHPLLPFAVKGAIWYQGESNAGRAYEYRTLMPTLIQDWRKRFGTELPFMIVQLAPFKGGQSGVDYAELRDAQLNTTKVLPKVGLAVITDVGNENNIHPIPKQPVGERLAIAALSIAYGKSGVSGGPVFKDKKAAGDKLILNFDNVGGGLVAKDGELTGFEVAGPDKKFFPAKAVIEGSTVVVSSDKVSNPVDVRYGWVNFAKPTLNMFNKEGLPASPFRTDDLPLTTAPKK
jgi:sialate O-acetylesterase